MFIGQLQSALRGLYGYGWGLPPPTAFNNPPQDKPGRLGDAAAGASALEVPEPPSDQPAPQRVQPGQEGQAPGNQGQSGGGSSSEGAQDSLEQAELRALQSADRQVRAHEQAHVAAGGPYVSGGASFTYQTGPDGRQYAVGGEVPIDASPVGGNPEATIKKAQTIRSAALAPADPSPQDRSVAAAAAQMEAQARLEQAQRNAQEQGLAQGQNQGPSQDAPPMTSGAPPPLVVRLRPLSIYV